MSKKKILLLGTGGHCLSVLDSLITLSSYDAIGLIDKKINATPTSQEPRKIMGIPILGDDSDLEGLFAAGYSEAFITVGSIGDVSLRKKIYMTIKQIGFHVPNIIDKSSVLSSFAILGDGIYVGKNSIINAGTRIGDCAIINTSSVIEHECSIGDFVHISPRSTLCGGVMVETGTHIGAGSVVKQNVHIGEDTMVGMGSVVLNDIDSRVVAFGNPCKEVKYE